MKWSTNNYCVLLSMYLLPFFRFSFAVQDFASIWQKQACSSGSQIYSRMASLKWLFIAWRRWIKSINSSKIYLLEFSYLKVDLYLRSENSKGSRTEVHSYAGTKEFDKRSRLWWWPLFVVIQKSLVMKRKQQVCTLYQIWFILRISSLLIAFLSVYDLFLENPLY